MEEGNKKKRWSWRQKLSSIHGDFVKAAPLSAVGIVVVVLLIVIQVCALGALDDQQSRATQCFLPVLVEVGGICHRSAGIFHQKIGALLQY